MHQGVSGWQKQTNVGNSRFVSGKFSFVSTYTETEVKEMDQVKIGKFITQLRKEKGMTQQQLAEKLGVTDRSVSRWENGINLPDASLFDSLCMVLGTQMEELLSGEKKHEEKKAVNKGKTSLYLGILLLLSLISGVIGYHIRQAEEKVEPVVHKDVQPVTVEKKKEAEFCATETAQKYQLNEKDGYQSAMLKNVGFYFPKEETVSITEQIQDNANDSVLKHFREDLSHTFRVSLEGDQEEYQFDLTVISDTDQKIFEKKTGYRFKEEEKLAFDESKLAAYRMPSRETGENCVAVFGKNTSVFVRYAEDESAENIMKLIGSSVLFENDNVGYLSVKYPNLLAREEPTLSCSQYMYLKKGDAFTVKEVIQSDGFTWYHIEGIGYVNPLNHVSAEYVAK